MQNFMTFMLNNSRTDLVKETDLVETKVKGDIDSILTGNEIDFRNLKFSEKKGINTRAVTALGFYGINTIEELLLIDINDFGKRYGVGKVVLEMVDKKIKELKNN